MLTNTTPAGAYGMRFLTYKEAKNRWRKSCGQLLFGEGTRGVERPVVPYFAPVIPGQQARAIFGFFNNLRQVVGGLWWSLVCMGKLSDWEVSDVSGV